MRATGVALAMLLALPLVASAQSLPSGWASSDIGSPAIAGSATYSSSTYTIAGAGTDIWNSSDQFRFVYRQISGDVTIIARVATLQKANDWSKAGVMIRESLAGGSKHGFALVSAAKGLAFQRRRSTSGSSLHTDGGTGVAPMWVKLQRVGSTLTASRSSNGSTWTVIGTDTISMASTVYVGLAITSHATTAKVTATVSNVTVQTTTAPTNQLPAVSLTAPASGASFTSPATVSLAATASDTDGSISKVEFYQGSTLIAADTTSPYSFSWSNVAAGSYSITAVATDNAGGKKTSTARSITVTGPASNQPPAVSLTAPASGAGFAAGASITVSATASDTDGTVARVDFYQGSTLIGSDTASPYSITWSAVPAGSYSVVAVAQDNAGATTTSGARTVIVSAATYPDTAVFVPSSNDASVSNYLLKVFTAGSNPATATAIASQNLGKPPIVNGECASDIASVVSALPSGTYIATVTAVGTAGSSQSSPSAQFTR